MAILSSSFLQILSPTNNNALLFKHSPSSSNVKFSHTAIQANYGSIPLKLHTPNQSKKPNPSLTTFFNSIEYFISRFLDPPLSPSIDPKSVLSGSFSPVDELPPTPCMVEGCLPPCLNGAYIRNGPNPQFVPNGPYHLFDGDGMLHSIKISQGNALYCCRFVKTYKYQVERETGSPVVLNYFSAFTNFPASVMRWMVNRGRLFSVGYDLCRGIGSANTSLAFIGGKLLALCESDLPYEIELTDGGDLITLGRQEAFGEVAMTAHPKVDRETGEAFAFRHDVQRPFLVYFRFDSGVKQPEVPIFSMVEASMVHDFAVTENYAVFPETQLVINPGEILRGNPLVQADLEKIPRLGVIPRYAADGSEMRWVEAPGLNVFHAVNAWEEHGSDGDKIVVVAPNVSPVERVLDGADLVHASMERIEINVEAKTVTRRRIAAGNLDFGVINPSYVGRKNRFMYAAVGTISRITGVVKLDLSRYESGDCRVARRMYGRGCYGGEPFFVAREADNPAAEEDDGYLVSYVHDETTNESKFIVMDAKSENLERIAAVRLPRRVPCGFHGIFVREDDLKKKL